VKFVASLHAFDVLDVVHIQLVVREYTGYADGPAETVHISEHLMPGEGVDEWSKWAADVLVYVLEAL
jgi:hypothetical protein